MLRTMYGACCPCDDADALLDSVACRMWWRRRWRWTTSVGRAIAAVAQCSSPLPAARWQRVSILTATTAGGPSRESHPPRLVRGVAAPLTTPRHAPVAPVHQYTSLELKAQLGHRELSVLGLQAWITKLS